MKGIALRKHSLHEKSAASVLSKLFISRFCHVDLKLCIVCIVILFSLNISLIRIAHKFSLTLDHCSWNSISYPLSLPQYKLFIRFLFLFKYENKIVISVLKRPDILPMTQLVDVKCSYLWLRLNKSHQAVIWSSQCADLVKYYCNIIIYVFWFCLDLHLYYYIYTHTLIL